MTDDDSQPPKQKPYDGPARSAPYPLSRLAPSFELVDLAQEIQKADSMLSAVAGNKLKLIADQIRALQAQARGMLEQTQRDARLHRARCNFKKRIGAIYHLYEKPDGVLYFSMLSPDDWGGACPHEHQGSYRLEPDMSWTPLDKVPTRDEEEAAMQLLMGPLGVDPTGGEPR